MVATTDSASQLVQLSQAEFIGPVNQNGVGVGYVDTRLNDGRAHQHIEALVIEVAHDLFQLTFTHLSVTDHHARFRDQLSQALRGALDGFYIIVKVVNLAASQKLTQDGFFDQR